MAIKFLAKKGLGLLGKGKKGEGQKKYKSDVKKFKKAKTVKEKIAAERSPNVKRFLTRPNKGDIAFKKEIKNLLEEFDGDNVSAKYGRKLGKGAMSGEKRAKGRYFHTSKFPKGRKK
jgi:hypothetical protein